MAFKFNWPNFSEKFYADARALLEDALNKDNRPKNIVDHITVKELNMGTMVCAEEAFRKVVLFFFCHGRGSRANLTSRSSVLSLPTSRYSRLASWAPTSFA